MALPNLSGLSLHAAAPTDMHPRYLDGRMHSEILFNLIANELNKGTPFWERSITETVLSWAEANHVRLPVERLGEHSTHMGEEAFEMLITDLRNNNMLPLPNNFAAEIGWPAQPQQGQSAMYWMLGLCWRTVDTRNWWVRAIKGENGYPEWLMNAPNWLKDDRDTVLVAVTQDPPAGSAALEHASLRLRNDREVVLAAVKASGVALEHASLPLRNDREVVLAAVEENGQALSYASNRLKDDEQVVLAAVEKDPYAFIHASNRLRDDPEMMRAYGRALI